jgi:hypothetical protein
MAVTITDQTSTIKFAYSDGNEYNIDKDGLSIKKGLFFVHISNSDDFVDVNTSIRLRYTDVSSPAVASNDELISLLLGYKASSAELIGSVQLTDGTTSLKIEPNGSMPVTLQDQTTPIVIVPFSHLEQATTTTAAMAIDDRTVTVASVTGIVDGKHLTIFDPIGVRFSQFYVIGAPVGNVVTLDRPVDFAYPSGSYVDVNDTEMAVNGSVTPQLFGLRNNAGATPPPGIDLTMDVTRIIFECVTTALPELDMFGDIVGGITNGLFARRRDGTYHNIFNVKTNGEMAGIMYDWSVIEAAKFGVNGFLGRLTFAGQSKMGVAIRLAINEDMEILVQDDLTGLISLKIVAEGSIVEE